MDDNEPLPLSLANVSFNSKDISSSMSIIGNVLKQTGSRLPSEVDTLISSQATAGIGFVQGTDHIPANLQLSPTRHPMSPSSIDMSHLSLTSPTRTTESDSNQLTPRVNSTDENITNDRSKQLINRQEPTTFEKPGISYKRPREFTADSDTSPTDAVLKMKSNHRDIVKDARKQIDDSTTPTTTKGRKSVRLTLPLMADSKLKKKSVNPLHPSSIQGSPSKIEQTHSNLQIVEQYHPEVLVTAMTQPTDNAEQTFDQGEYSRRPPRGDVNTEILQDIYSIVKSTKSQVVACCETQIQVLDTINALSQRLEDLEKEVSYIHTAFKDVSRLVEMAEDERRNHAKGGTAFNQYGGHQDSYSSRGEYYRQKTPSQDESSSYDNWTSPKRPQSYSKDNEAELERAKQESWEIENKRLMEQQRGAYGQKQSSSNEPSESLTTSATTSVERKERKDESWKEYNNSYNQPSKSVSSTDRVAIMPSKQQYMATETKTSNPLRIAEIARLCAADPNGVAARLHLEPWVPYSIANVEDATLYLTTAITTPAEIELWNSLLRVDTNQADRRNQDRQGSQSASTTRNTDKESEKSSSKEAMDIEEKK